MDNEKELTGPNCHFHPRLESMPLEELLAKFKLLKQQCHIVGKEVQRRIYKIENRK